MKRKLLIMILAIISCFACVFGLTACGGNAHDSGNTSNGGNGQSSIIEVISISLNKTSLSLVEGKAERLIVTITPSNATNKKLSWESSDTSVATVMNGAITAHKEGIAFVTVTCGNKSATCTVTVTEKVIPHTHELTLVPAKVADCEVAGNTAYYTCNCGKWFEDANAKNEITDKSGVILKATGHSYSEEWTTTSTQHWHNAICGHTLTTEKQVHNFENMVCTDCGYEKNMLTFKTLEVTDDTVYGKVSNATEDFSFIKEITADSGVIFYVCTDKACKNVIPSKTVNLEIGDNTFYILADGGNNIKLYTVTLRRRPIHTVTFDTDGGTEIETQYIEEDKIVAEPEIEKRGYTFNSWSVKNEVIRFPYIVAEPVTVKANFTANSYSVELDVNGGNDLEETKLSVTFDSEFNFPATEKVGYSLLGWYIGETQLTDANGKSIAKWTLTENKTVTAKWSINSYSVAINKNINAAGEINNLDASIVFDSEVNLVAKTYLGYIWQGWYNGSEKLTEELIYSFIMPAENLLYTAKWELDERLSNFNFTSTETTCTITGVKDKNITKVVIPDYVTSIGRYSFNGCSSLTNVIIGNGVTSIEECAFIHCSSLSSVTIGNGVTSIGGISFYDCTGLTRVYYTGDIGSWCAISGLDNLMVYGSELKTLFIGGKKVSGELIIPDGVTSIENCAFYGCSGLTSVTIPAGVTSIGNSAFSNCSGLTSVTIPAGVTSIGNSAFSNCSGLTSVTIPASVTSIGYRAFYGCSNMESAVFLGAGWGWGYYSPPSTPNSQMSYKGSIDSYRFSSTYQAANTLTRAYCDYYLKRSI